MAFTNTAWGLDTGRDTDWRSDAACARPGVDPEWFFNEGRGNQPSVDVAVAKAVCAGCNVTAECLAESLARGDQFGIFGGLTPVERRERGLKRLRRNYCRNGHPFTEENTYWDGNGHRACRRCARERVNGTRTPVLEKRF